jgi:hypothetical protein
VKAILGVEEEMEERQQEWQGQDRPQPIGPIAKQRDRGAERTEHHDQLVIPECCRLDQSLVFLYPVLDTTRLLDRRV